MRARCDELSKENTEQQIRIFELEMKSEEALQSITSGQCDTILPTKEVQMPDYIARMALMEEENRRLREENERLTREREEMESEGPAEEIELHDKVRLEVLLQFMEYSGLKLEKGKKKQVAEVMRAITSIPISTCRNYCSNRGVNTNLHEDEVVRLIVKLRSIGINVHL